ncbi:MAG TPA: hypothetical protein VFQ28_09745, partial [Gaiella sp.]|nr:hypothetical protein [Gaiella sp.]
MGRRGSTAWFSALLVALCLVAVAGTVSSPSAVATTFVQGFLASSKTMEAPVIVKPAGPGSRLLRPDAGRPVRGYPRCAT